MAKKNKVKRTLLISKSSKPKYTLPAILPSTRRAKAKKHYGPLPSWRASPVSIKHKGCGCGKKLINISL